MKMKKVLAILLSAVMLITMSQAAFGATYVVNEFAEDYVICEENFAGGEIHSNLIEADGNYELYDQKIKLSADSNLTVDLAGAGKSVNEGIVNISFAFTPGVIECESDYVVATHKFDFGGGFVLDAQWEEYGPWFPFLKDGKFMANETELIKFNADGTGGGDPGTFAADGEEAEVPSLYYGIDAKINFNTKKINITITEKETTSSGETESVIVNNAEFDYKADSLGYFTESFTSEDNIIQFYSYNHYLNISTEGTASYTKVDGVRNVTYIDDYTFQKDRDAWLTFDPYGNHSHYVDLTERPATSGIINVSTQFWPDATNGTLNSETARQTIEFGSGFSVNAQWATAGSNSVRIKDGKFVIGSTSLTMNKDAWTVNETGTLFIEGMKEQGAIGWYDISAKINLDTKKVQLKIVEHLEYNGEERESILTENGDVDYLEFDYLTNIFNYYRNSLSSDSTAIRSYNNNLLIKAEGTVSYNSEDDVDVRRYPEDFVFQQDNDTCFVLENEKKYLVDLTNTYPVSEGIVNISYKFWPNLHFWGGLTGGKAQQTFKLGEGFGFSANWETHGASTNWMDKARFNVDGETIVMNPTGWNGAYNAPGTLRRKGAGGGAEGAYDISAQINLNTKKINLKIVETLTNGDGTPQVTTLVNKEYPYNSNVFSYYESSLVSNDTVPATAETPNRMLSDNSSLLIQADGLTSYNPEAALMDIVLKNDSTTYTLQNGVANEYKVELGDKAVNGGIVDVSFRFWPNMNPVSPTAQYQAVHTFDFGGGFSFDAKWKPYGGASWMIGGNFDFGENVNKFWNTEKRGGASDIGWFRVKDSNANAPHVYFDISAKINLDTKKLNLTIEEHLETAADEWTKKLCNNQEFNYNADSFDYYKASLKTVDILNKDALVGAEKDACLQGLNSNLLIQGDGKLSFKGDEAVEDEFVVSDTVEVKNGANAVTTFAEFNAAQNPFVNLKFNNETGTDFNAVMVIAYYKGGQLASIDTIKNITASALYDKVEYNYNLKKADVDADSVKVFVWNDITGIMPLKKAAIIQ